MSEIAYEQAREILPRGPVFSEDNTSEAQRRILDRWLVANRALRHVPMHSLVVIRGRYVEYDEHAIRRARGQFKRDADRAPVLYDRDGEPYLPSRRVRLRIRRPLGPWLHSWARGLA